MYVPGGAGGALGEAGGLAGGDGGGDGEGGGFGGGGGDPCSAIVVRNPMSVSSICDEFDNLHSIRGTTQRACPANWLLLTTLLGRTKGRQLGGPTL